MTFYNSLCAHLYVKDSGQIFRENPEHVSFECAFSLCIAYSVNSVQCKLTLALEMESANVNKQPPPTKIQQQSQS